MSSLVCCFSLAEKDGITSSARQGYTVCKNSDSLDLTNINTNYALILITCTVLYISLKQTFRVNVLHHFMVKLKILNRKLCLFCLFVHIHRLINKYEYTDNYFAHKSYIIAHLKWFSFKLPEVLRFKMPYVTYLSARRIERCHIFRISEIYAN